MKNVAAFPDVGALFAEPAMNASDCIQDDEILGVLPKSEFTGFDGSVCPFDGYCA